MTCRLVLAGLVTASLGGACHRQTAPAAPGPPQSPAPSVGAPATPPGIGMDGATKPLLQLLVDEKAHRPGGTPPAETLFAALEKAGITTQDRSQVLGRTVGAAFCENAHTARGIVLSVCEFADGVALARGRAYSETAFAKALPNRALLVNKKTLLTINPPDGSTGMKADIDTIGRTFMAL